MPSRLDELPRSPFFDVIKRHRPTTGPPVAGRSIQPKATDRDARAVACASSSVAAGLSNVPYLAAIPSNPKLNLLGELFGIRELIQVPEGCYLTKSHKLWNVTLPVPDKPHAYVTAEVRAASVKIRVLSPDARRRRLHDGLKVNRSMPREIRSCFTPGTYNDIQAFVHDSTLVLTAADLAIKSTRGAITEFSEKARDRLKLMAYELQALGIKPDIMLTLTYPGAWQSCVPDGREAKRHLQAMKKRINRYLKFQGFPCWSALWFAEFQKRGAPHFHLIMWGPMLKHLDHRRMRRWALNAWADIVNHPEPLHRARGRKAGTGVDKMRKDHFGYAAQYASKMHQKLVPEGYRNVGRFWGLWNFKPPAPVPMYRAMSFEQLCNLASDLESTVRSHSENYADRILKEFLGGVSSYSADFKPETCRTVYGVAAAQVARLSLDSG